MELFLNILWLLIVLGSVAVWRARWTRQAGVRRHAAWREWTAFVCAMVLLFFVVSLTDDLHAEVMLLEEGSSSRRHATCLACPHHASQAGRGVTAYGSAILPLGPPVESLAFFAPVLPVSGNLQLLFNVQRAAGRSPPSSIL